MSILDVLYRVCDRGGILGSIWESRFDGDPKFVTGYCLSFSELDVSIWAESESDTVGMAFGAPPSDPDVSWFDMTLEDPWKQVVGQQLYSGWQLQNQSGYVDGVRFAFGPIGELIEFELIVAASMFEIYLAQSLDDA